VVFVGGGKPGIFPVTGSTLPSHWFEVYHPSQGSLPSLSISDQRALFGDEQVLKLAKL